MGIAGFYTNYGSENEAEIDHLTWKTSIDAVYDIEDKTTFHNRESEFPVQFTDGGVFINLVQSRQKFIDDFVSRLNQLATILKATKLPTFYCLISGGAKYKLEEDAGNSASQYKMRKISRPRLFLGGFDKIVIVPKLYIYEEQDTLPIRSVETVRIGDGKMDSLEPHLNITIDSESALESFILRVKKSPNASYLMIRDEYSESYTYGYNGAEKEIAAMQNQIYVEFAALTKHMQNGEKLAILRVDRGRIVELRCVLRLVWPRNTGMQIVAQIEPPNAAQIENVASPAEVGTATSQ